MGAIIQCFKGYEIVNKKEYPDEYEFLMKEKKYGDFIYPSILWQIDEFLESIGIVHCLRNMISIIDGEPCFESITKHEAEYIEFTLNKPESCLKYIKENRIIERLIEEKPTNHDEMLFVLDHIVKYLSEGYYIIYYY